MKNRNYLLFIIGILLLWTGAFAAPVQAQIRKTDMIGITPVVSDEMPFPQAVKDVLYNKTRQILTSNGMAEVSERFVLVPNITVLTKDVTATAPPMYAMNLDISFYVLDPVEGVIANEISFPVKVAGNQEAKAYIQGINKITPSSSEVRAFVDVSKKRIIDYYNAHLPTIIKQAHSMAAQGQYDEACSRLSSIPEVVNDYDAVGEAIVEIVKQRYNVEADKLINEAKGKIAVKDYAGAMEALAKVDPVSDRFSAAEKLVAQVKATIEAKERAAIAAQMKRYEDNKEMALRVHDDKVALTKQSIEAARQIGVAQAQSQKPTIISVVNNWFKAKFGK